MVSLKCLNNFWRTREIPLINCEIHLTLAWSASCFISNATANQETTFAITDTKFNASVVIVSTQDNIKLLHKLKLGFKITINWNKYQSKVT